MRVIYFILGAVCLVLGGIGVILPILPTTPFLLVSAYCFGKCSTRLHTWFTQTKLYEKHLSEFVTNRAMPARTKLRILVFASSMLILAAIMVDNLHARIAIGVVILFKYYYFIFRIKTIRNEEVTNDD